MSFLKIISLLFFSISICIAQPSVLNSGIWLKLSTKEAGVYKIDEAFLKKNKIDTRKLNPQHIKIFRGHSGVLPQSNSEYRQEGLIEIPVFCQDLNGKWDRNDQILFYAPSSHKEFYDEGLQRFVHEINPYSDFNFVFLNIASSPSKRIENLGNSTPVGEVITSLPYFHWEEEELKNVLNSGRGWLGSFFFNELSFKLNLKDFDNSTPIKFYAEVVGISREKQVLNVSIDRNENKKYELPQTFYNSADAFARYNRYANFTPIDLSFKATGEVASIDGRLSTENSLNAGAYIDFYRLEYLRKFKFLPKNQVPFKNFRSPNTASFLLENVTTDAALWLIDENNEPVNVILKAGQPFHLDVSKKIINFHVFDKTAIDYPSLVGEVKNQNIKEGEVPEMLIVFAERFRSEVERLILHKKQFQNLEVLGISTEEIFNELSSGKTDPTAIRDYCRYFYLKNPEKFKYLLLVGDASFDYKNNNKFGFVDIKNLVPTYQSRESMEPIYSFSSDDYFGFLENHEGEWPEGYSKNNFWYSNFTDNHTMDIAVGRLPVKTLLEAKNVVSKIIDYEKADIAQNNWKNKLLFVADNRDYNIHQRDAENLSKLAEEKFGGFQISKIYLDDFPIEGTGQNSRSPLANEKLNTLINQGTFLVNFNGHGSEDGWTQEKLLGIGDILNWRNKDKLPIFFTATCQFGKFDNPSVVSAAELAILSPDGGGIALLTTTRPVYSSTNEKINTAFFKNLTSAVTLGELFRLTKNQSVFGEINRNFSLLGDPSLKIPKFQNQLEDFSLEKDEIVAGGRYKIKGKMKLVENGRLFLNMYDKAQTLKTRGTFDDSPPFEFSKKDQLLFQTNLEVKNYLFDGEIVVPSDILEGKGKGLITVFSSNSYEESFGYYHDFILNGDELLPVTDAEGPVILHDLNRDNQLNFELLDESGFRINDNFSMLINDTLMYNLTDNLVLESTHKKGIINFFVGFLPEGNHNIKFIVYDNHNNKTTYSFQLKISKPEFKIQQFLNYPNPFFSYTTLVFNHNRKGDDLEAKIILFDTDGKQVREQIRLCKNCDEKLEFGLDFEDKIYNGSQIYFKLLLKSLSDQSQVISSGKMLFWK
jgi:hypothetical protein